MKAFSIVGPTMRNELLTDELRERTIETCLEETEISSFQSSLLIAIPFSRTFSRVLI